MKSLLCLTLATVVACQSDRNMNGATGARRSESQTSAPRPPTPSTRKVTVLFFGTSLTAGLGLDPSQAFPALVAQQAAAEGMPIEAINAGLSGETSAGALRRIDWVMKQPVDVVVLETGGNDALRALDVSALESNLTAIVERVKKIQPRATILLAEMEAPPNFGADYTSKFREAYRAVAKKEGVALLPFLLDGVAGKPEMNQEDGVHPNVQGERIVADNVWHALKPIVVKRIAKPD